MFYLPSCALKDTYSTFSVTVEFPDKSYIGKKVILVLQLIDTDMRPITLMETLESYILRKNVQIADKYIDKLKKRLAITVYFYDMLEDPKMDFTIHNTVPCAYMDTSIFRNDLNFIEMYGSPKSFFNQVFNIDDTFSFYIYFPKSINIQMDHENFTSNHPIVKWETFPNFNRNYAVSIIVSNKDERYIVSDNIPGTTWFVAYKEYTKENNVIVLSEGVKFSISYHSGGMIKEPSIISGDIFRIEVYVLIGITDLNRSLHGDLYMDSLTILVK